MALDPIQVVLTASDQSADGLASIAKRVATLTQDIQTQFSAAFTGSNIGAGLVDSFQGAASQLSGVFGQIFGGATGQLAGLKLPDGTIDGYIGLASALKGSYDSAARLATELQLQPEAIEQAVQELKRYQAVDLDKTTQFQRLSQSLNLTEAQFEKLSTVAKKGLGGGSEGGGGIFGKLGSAATSLAEGPIGAVSFAFNNVTESIGKLKEFGSQVFEGLIAQVVEIRGQTLGIASVIAATQQVSVDGKKIDNPLEAIQATLPEVQRGIEQLKRDSTETVLTTSQLIPVYQTVAGQISNLGINLDQAEKLSVRLSQAASGINLPYQQAQQEINGIVRGEINQYNQLAKSLGISQTYYTQLVAQGRIYEVLIERTKALAQGQKLAADQLPGTLSTISDSFELIIQEAGGPLLDALLKPVIAFREFFKANQQTFEGVAKGLSTAFVGIVDGIVEPLTTQLQPAFEAIGNALQAIGKLFNDFAQNQGPVLGEFFGKLANLAGAALNAAIVVVVNAFTNLVKIFDVIINNPIIQFLGGQIFGALGLIVDAVTATINVFSGFGTASTNVFGGLFDGLAAAEKQVSKALAPLGTAFKEIQLIVGAVFGGIGSKIQAAFAPVLPILKAIGGAIVAGLVAPIKFVGDAFNGLFGFVGQVTAKIRDIIGGIIDNPAFKAFAKLVGVNIEEVRAGLKKLNEDASGEGLKKAGEGAEKAGKDFKTANLALDDLGKTSDLIKVQLAGAFKDLGNRDKAEDAAKRVVDLTQKALENGTISRAEAEKNLAAIQNNTGLQLDTRLNAEKAATKIIQDGGKERLDAIKERETEIQDQIKSGALSQIEGEKQLTAIKLEESDKQIEITQKALDREGAEGRGLGPKATELRRQLQQQQADRTTIVEDGERKRAAAVTQGFDNEQKLLEGKKAKGLVTEAQFADESLALTNKRLDAEVEELERQKAKLSASDAAGRQAIAAKEAEIDKKRVDAAEAFEQRKLAILERAQKVAEDAIKLSQVKQDTEIQKLLNSRAIRQVEAEELRVKAKQKVDQQELELEKQKTAALEALPKLSDPEKEAARQEKIRAARIKTAELTGQIVKDEYDRQQAAFKVFSEAQDRQAQAAKNAVEAQVQPLQNQLQLQDALSRSLDNQNKLLEARKGLQDSLSGFVQGELGILAQTAKSDRDKKNIAEITAAIKLRSLQQQQAIERQVLELNLLQEQAALRKEKIQNRIAQLQNSADQAQAKADLAKVKADPNATPEAIEAAQENVRAKQGAGLGLQLQGALLDQQGQQQAVLAGFKRQTLNNNQELQRDEARAALIQTLPEGGLKQEAIRNLQRDTLRKLGLSDGGDLSQLTPITEQISQAARLPGGVGNFGLGSLNPVARQGVEAQQSSEVDRLSKQFETFSQGGSNTSIEKLVARSPQLSNSDSKAQEDRLQKQIDGGNLSPEQVAAKQKTIEALRAKRTQLVELTGGGAFSLSAIDKNTKATADALGGKTQDTRRRSPEDQQAGETDPKAQPDRAVAGQPLPPASPDALTQPQAAPPEAQTASNRKPANGTFNISDDLYSKLANRLRASVAASEGLEGKALNARVNSLLDTLGVSMRVISQAESLGLIKPDRATATLPPVPGRNTAATAAGIKPLTNGTSPPGSGITVNMTNQVTNNITGDDVRNGNLGRQTEQHVLNALFNVATVARNQRGSLPTK